MMESSALEQRELSRNGFPLTWKVLESAVAEGVAPGFVVGLWEKKNPDLVQVSACGKRRIIPSPLPMESDTIFDLASVSKVFATAPLAAVLVDRGWLSWDTPLSSILPDYPFQNIQIQHLLSHTAGLVWWQPFWEKLRDFFAPDPLYLVSIEKRQKAMKDLVFSVTPECAPGERAVYSDLSFLLLGFALEEIAQMSLDQAVKKWVWQPMGIRNAFYRRVKRPVERAVMPSVAATEQCPWRGGVLQGQVHDDNCWSMGGYAGHSGAFGTARDVLHFARGLMWGKFLSPATLHAVWNRVSRPAGCDRTLGWDTPSGETPSAGRKFSPRSVGHLGFTGTSLWIDPEAELAVVLLSNRVHPSRENILIRAFRPQLHEAVRLDLRR